MSKVFEFNFDGLVGPTHNYAGLSSGNLASTSHRNQFSSPLDAVLQGLEKMKRLSDLGFKQGVLPPQERPLIPALRDLGFEGSDNELLQKVAQDDPDLLYAVSSSASMWTANAATVSPSADTADHKVHFTPANLVSKYHRSLEAPTTSAILKATFKSPQLFVHHSALPSVAAFGDEGAANHTRLCREYGEKGVEFFVYGLRSLSGGGVGPHKYVARQTYEASEAIARLHQLEKNAVVFAQQNPDAIDAGVFHNDVAGVGNCGVYFYHEESFLDPKQVLTELKEKYRSLCNQELRLIQVPASSVSLTDAVKSYLFNSQLINLPSGGMALVLPKECETTPSVVQYLKMLLKEEGDLIRELLYFDLNQSMRNGGGPACLRLRIVLTEQELAAVTPGVLMNDDLYQKLTRWAKKHYRDRLKLDDLRDSKLVQECRVALDELTTLLGLGSIYPFQNPNPNQK